MTLLYYRQQLNPFPACLQESGVTTPEALGANHIRACLVSFRRRGLVESGSGRAPAGTRSRGVFMNGGGFLTPRRILGHASLEAVRLDVDLDTNDLPARQRKYSPMDVLAHYRAAIN